MEVEDAVSTLRPLGSLPTWDGGDSRDGRSRRRRISVRAPRRPLRKISAVRSHQGPPRIGDPVPIRGTCFPLGGHPLPRKPSETGTGQLGTRLAPSNGHRSVEWLTRKGAVHVGLVGFQHRALRSWVRGHGSRSEDALAAPCVREPLACTTTATAEPSIQRDGRGGFNEGDSSALGGP